jgi:hypothetical protein
LQEFLPAHGLQKSDTGRHSKDEMPKNSALDHQQRQQNAQALDGCRCEARRSVRNLLLSDFLNRTSFAPETNASKRNEQLPTRGAIISSRG